MTSAPPLILTERLSFFTQIGRYSEALTAKMFGLAAPGLILSSRALLARLLPGGDVHECTGIICKSSQQIIGRYDADQGSFVIYDG